MGRSDGSRQRKGGIAHASERWKWQIVHARRRPREGRSHPRALSISVAHVLALWILYIWPKKRHLKIKGFFEIDFRASLMLDLLLVYMLLPAVWNQINMIYCFWNLTTLIQNAQDAMFRNFKYMVFKIRSKSRCKLSEESRKLKYLLI